MDPYSLHVLWYFKMLVGISIVKSLVNLNFGTAALVFKMNIYVSKLINDQCNLHELKMINFTRKYYEALRTALTESQTGYGKRLPLFYV